MVLSLFFSLHDFIRDYWKIPVRLLNLPILARNEIIKSMTYISLIKLSMVSKRMENAIKSCKIPLPNHNIHIGTKKGAIDLWVNERNVVCCGTKRFALKKKLRRYHIERWCELAYGVDNLNVVVQRLQSLFKCQNSDLFFYWKFVAKEGFEQSDSIRHWLETCNTICLYDGKITTKNLEYIMKTARPDIYFDLLRMTVPIDFQCDDAFKFRSIRFDDSRWVKLEDLLTLKEKRVVKLFYTKLQVSDVNTFLKHWKKSDCDMFRGLVIHSYNPLVDGLFDGLVVLKCVKKGYDLRFLISDSKTKKSREILCVYATRNDCLQLSTWSPDSIFRVFAETFESLKEEYEILKVLERKVELEKQLGQEENEQKHRMEINDIKTFLQKKGVTFLNGEYHF